MFKKSLTIFICVAVLFCLSACNKHNDNTNSTTSSSEETNNVQENIGEEELETPQPPVFKTENIKRITFYGYYGSGKASEVPSENMAEIINWLGSFTVDKMVTDQLDGINTHVVEIEYNDGTIIKNGIDTISIDGVQYHIKRDKEPDCYYDIISKSTLTLDDVSSNETKVNAEPVFKTENIKRITFYGYYGAGKGCEVPSESMEEIINWLKTFKTDKKVDIMPPGTNTHTVEIEYIDGTIIKNGLDAVQIDGTLYFIKKNKQPDCYYDIISKSTLPIGES